MSDPYEILAEYYEVLFGDWNQALESTGEWLDEVLEPVGVHSVLDCTCGTGLQSIALAKRGYKVTGFDISQAMLNKARRNARQAGVTVRWVSTDIRLLPKRLDGCFDAVITCGNSLLHLTGENDLHQALVNMYKVTRQGGYCLIEIADHEGSPGEKEPFPYYETRQPDGRRIIFFAIKHKAGKTTNLDAYRLKETQNGWEVTSRSMVLKLPRKKELLLLLTEAGFGEISDISRAGTITLLARKAILSDESVDMACETVSDK
jgi:ubiquinone/menaquinone biosynthesis C-methylase UbiE